MIYLPVDHLEQIVVAGKFQKHWVASGPLQIFTRNFSTLVELTGTIEWFLQFWCPLISNCSMMPAWHQLVSMSGHVEESETARKLQLYATSIYQVHSFVCQLDYLHSTLIHAWATYACWLYRDNWILFQNYSCPWLYAVPRHINHLRSAS